MKKTEALFIRVSQDELDRLKALAAKSFLAVSTWARTVLLKELRREEKSDKN